MNWGIPDLEKWIPKVPNWDHLPAIVLPDCSLPGIPNVHLPDLKEIDIPGVPKVDLPTLDANLILETIKVDLKGLPSIPIQIWKVLPKIGKVDINFPDLVKLALKVPLNLLEIPSWQLSPPDFALYRPSLDFVMPTIDVSLLNILPPTINFPKLIPLPKIGIPDWKIRLHAPPIPKIRPPTWTPFSFGIKLKKISFALFKAFFLLFPHLLDLIIELITMLFNVVLIHLTFKDIAIPEIDAVLPDLSNIIAAFRNLYGFLAEFVDAILTFFNNIIYWINILKSLAGYNCGGTLTLLAPLLFLVGGVVIYLTLERDWLLWLGVRLRTKSTERAVNKAFFQVASKVGTRTSLIVLQITVYSLSNAATLSTTSKSCNDIDFAANTFGKVVVGFFYLVFYGVLFFIFTGAPDWYKYDRTTWTRRMIWLAWDGVVRFGYLTTGVWNDITVRSYNIVQRAERYQAGKDVVVASANTPLSMHEMVMYLISTSRGVIWMPLPLCTIITKTSESLNKAPVFVWTTTTHVYIKRHFVVRGIIW